MSYDKQIHMAFRAMRRAGLLSRMNFMASASTAEDQMAVDYIKFLTTGKVKEGEVKGCVYFTASDNNDRLKKNKFFLTYGNIILDSGDEIGIGNKEVGEIVVNICKNAGIKTSWNGDPDNRIEVDLSDYTTDIRSGCIPIKEAK